LRRECVGIMYTYEFLAGCPCGPRGFVFGLQELVVRLTDLGAHGSPRRNDRRGEACVRKRVGRYPPRTRCTWTRLARVSSSAGRVDASRRQSGTSTRVRVPAN